MNANAENCVRELLNVGNGITDEQAAIVIQVIKGTHPLLRHENQEMQNGILTRKQVAVMIGKSLPTVDIYARRGIFRRVYLLPNSRVDGKKKIRQQAQGFTRESVERAIKSGLVQSV